MSSARSERATLLVGVSNPATAHRLVHLSSLLFGVRPWKLLLTHVVCVADQISLTTARSSPEVVRARDLLGSLVRDARELGVEVGAVVEVARTVDEGLIAAAESHAAEMILVGYSEEPTDPDDERSEERFDRTMHRVARKSERDMVVAKFRGEEMSRVLVPVAHDTPLRVVGMLCESLTRSTGASVSFFHVVDPEDSADEARAALAERLESAGIASLGSLTVVTGERAVDVVLEEAARHDLVVVAPGDRPSLMDAIFSDRARTIAEEATASVLLAWDLRTGT